MTPPKKISFWAKYIQPNLTLGLIIMVVGGGITYYLDQEKKQITQEAKEISIENRIPETVKEFTEWEDHMNEVPSDVDTYIREQRNLEIGTGLEIRQIKLDSQQVNIQKQLMIIDSFFTFAKGKKISDSITEIKKQKSRDKRTDDMEVQKAATLLILKKLNELGEKEN